MSEDWPRVGVSACLLGERVRYDGQEKRVSWVAEVLPRMAQIVAICPEVGAGMAVPRPPIQIVQRPGAKARLQVVGQSTDKTDAMYAFIESELASLAKLPLDGFILKARSPSCGLRDTPRFISADAGASRARVGPGLWAEALCAAFPKLVVVDESDLATESGQNEFLRRIQERLRS